MTLRLATRRSPLALLQAESVRARLAGRGVPAELVRVETRGDRHAERPLVEFAGQGAFAVEIQEAVLAGRADVAVHSAKDLPGRTPAGLVLSAVPERRDAADALVGRTLAALGPGATVATGSPRRRALLLERRPDLTVVGLRGNMATRLSALTRGVDAIVAAVAALERLGLDDQVSERLDVTWFIPQVGQGALALECREDDATTTAALATIDDLAAHAAVRAERAFLVELGAGCTIPAGAHAQVGGGGDVEIAGAMVGVDGGRSVRATLRGSDPEALGAALARRLRDDLLGSELPGWKA